MPTISCPATTNKTLRGLGCSVAIGASGHDVVKSGMEARNKRGIIRLARGILECERFPRRLRERSEIDHYFELSCRITLNSAVNGPRMRSRGGTSIGMGA